MLKTWSRGGDPTEKGSAPGVVSSKKVKFLPTVLPQAAKLLGASGFLTKSRLSGKNVLPQAAKLHGTSGFFKKENLPKVLPQAAKLPRTSGFL